MAAAIFALTGTLLGIFGTLATEFVRNRTKNIFARQDALRLACADFTASVARIWNLSIELQRKTGDAELAVLYRKRTWMLESSTNGCG